MVAVRAVARQVHDAESSCWLAQGAGMKLDMPTPSSRITSPSLYTKKACGFYEGNRTGLDILDILGCQCPTRALNLSTELLTILLRIHIV